ERALLIEAVVFDMDGVLCHYRIERRLALLASWSGQSPDTIHAAIWHSGFEDEAERGVVSADGYLKGFGERMGDPLSAAQWDRARPGRALACATAQHGSAGRNVHQQPVAPEATHRRGVSRRPRHLRPAGDLLGGARPEQARPGGLPPPGHASRGCARRDSLFR